MIPLSWLADVQFRVREHSQVTPLKFYMDLGSFLKWENRQRTGSFIICGAIDKIFACLCESCLPYVRLDR